MFITTVFDTRDALYGAARILFQSTAQNHVKQPNAIIMPGGNTPRPLFKHVKANPFPVPDCLHLGYTDERLVPEDDPANNYALSAGMLCSLDVHPDHILRVDTTLPLNDAADRYDIVWRDFFDQDGAIPLAFVGLGADGHTCSLFTEAQIRACPGNRFAMPVVHDDGPDRVTVTPLLLSRVKHIIMLVTGKEKSAIVDAITKEPQSVVAVIALSGCPRVSIWYAAQ